MNFITEHGISSYEELAERSDAASAANARIKADLRGTEQRIAGLSLLKKNLDIYRKLKPTYERYKAAKDKEKFLRGFESEIILFEAAAKQIKSAGLDKLPPPEKLKAETDALAARKAILQAEHQKAQKEEKEYSTLRQNVDMLLDKPQNKKARFPIEL